MKPRRVTILRKGLLVLALPFVYQALFIGLLLKRQHDHSEAQFAAVHTKDVLLQADHVYQLLLLSQSNLRAYILTEHPTFSKQLEDGSQLIDPQLNKLLAMVQDNPRQQERFGQVSIRAKERLAYERTMAELVRKGDREQLQYHLKNLTGQPSMDALKEELRQFR